MARLGSHTQQAGSHDRSPASADACDETAGNTPQPGEPLGKQAGCHIPQATADDQAPMNSK